MNENKFRAYLRLKDMSQEEIEQHVVTIANLEAILQKHTASWTLEDLSPSSIQCLMDDLIDIGENSVENLVMMLRYAKATDNQELFITIFEMLDGSEAMENLSSKLAEQVGEDLRDIIFEDLEMPPLGLSKREKARFTYRVMRRMEEIFEERVCREVLSDSLRDLPDTYFIEQKSDYYNTCEGNLDRFLLLKGEQFIDTLRHHQQQETLFFGQEITEAVIDFVKSYPEIGGGVRNGNVIFETKIPFNTKAYLEEKDPEARRYLYCHCPWVKESLRSNTLKVSATFCQCSAGFHKKIYEVIFEQKLKAEVLQSVLKGDDRCRFAIHLPE